ncbi:MAG: hypothetical protein JOZ07_19190 [Solirubrobacterales bacterium]|nr:hypothetical protein [Solirubrobacterales bacterium]
MISPIRTGCAAEPVTNALQTSVPPLPLTIRAAGSCCASQRLLPAVRRAWRACGDRVA